MFRQLFIIILLTLIFTPIHAHDPGLSRSKVVLHKSGLSIQMIFSRQDIDILLLTSTSNSLPIKQFSIVQSKLQPIIESGITVRDKNNLHQHSSINIETESNDGLKATINYLGINTSNIKLNIPLIEMLSRGHRQYMTVEDANGEQIAQYILNARSPPIILKGMGLSDLGVFQQYLLEGIKHIWKGLDHVLFLVTLLLPAVLVYRGLQWQPRNKIRPAITDILKVVTAFTLAHSITLALSILNIINIPASIVEPVIAFSVFVVAVNNLRPFFLTSRWLLAFSFGLMHGFGFASVLISFGLSPHALTLSLLGFNIGVEIGQLAIVALVFPISALIRHTQVYRTWIFSGGSLISAFIAIIWMIDRVLYYKLLALYS